MSSAHEQSDKSREGGGFMEIFWVVVHALILAIIVRTFLYQPFNIPSGSMLSTLRIGDYLFVSKFSYGYSKYSFPFSPDLFDGRILAQTPTRGDVIVFKLPRDKETDYIKRLIGLPGDRVQMIDGVLHINGEAVKKERIDDFVEKRPDGRTVSIPRFKETLPNGVSYHVLDTTPNSSQDNTIIYQVPPGHYFMMGDNRDNSADSRILASVGFVPEENLVGRADIIFFSIGDGAAAWQIWRWPASVRWDRIFKLVD